MSKHEGTVATYKFEFLACRDFRHAWTHVDDYAILRNTRGAIVTFTREVKCLRCPVKRRDVYDGDMARLRGHYVYPSGYLTGTDNRIDGRAARRELLRRRIKS